MAYREVTMVEVKEVLRLWAARTGTKRIAAYLGLDRKTVRRYIAAGYAQGVRREQGEGAVTDEVVVGVLARCRRPTARPHGVGWSCCEAQRDFIARHLANGVRLSKIGKLLRRQGVEVPYATLRRWAVARLEFGRTAATIRVADGPPGQECQLDTGWVLQLAPDAKGKRRRLRAWIFTAVVSRHRFVWPIERETTASAIEACEAAWEFFERIFAVMIPDNTRAIIQRADALEPVINATFLEYAQARGFHVDPARVRKPRDKGRVERAVPTVREDCFAGEELLSIEQAREHGRRWCLEEYGLRRHTSTQRLPREHFEGEERAQLRPAPNSAYDIPLWTEPKVARDQHVQVAKALYSLPRKFLGKWLRARADRTLVRLYERGVLVKTHPRQPPGGRSTDPADFPEEKRVYAMRDIHYLQQQAAAPGAMIGTFATRLLEDPLPWTRMRRVYALLGLVRKYGAGRVEQNCTMALAADMLSVRRLQRMLALALPPSSAPPAPVSVPPARYLRPSTQYALAFGSSAVEGADGH